MSDKKGIDIDQELQDLLDEDYTHAAEEKEEQPAAEDLNTGFSVNESPTMIDLDTTSNQIAEIEQTDPGRSGVDEIFNSQDASNIELSQEGIPPVDQQAVTAHPETVSPADESSVNSEPVNLADEIEPEIEPTAMIRRRYKASELEEEDNRDGNEIGFPKNAWKATFAETFVWFKGLSTLKQSLLGLSALFLVVILPLLLVVSSLWSSDYFVRVDEAALRSGPGTEYLPIAHLYRGQQVQMLETYGDLVLIIDPSGRYGFVDQAHIASDKPPVNAENPFVGCNVDTYAHEDLSGCYERAKWQQQSCENYCDEGQLPDNCKILCQDRMTVCKAGCDAFLKSNRRNKSKQLKDEANTAVDGEPALLDQADEILSTPSDLKRHKKHGKKKATRKKKRHKNKSKNRKNKKRQH